MMTGAIAVHVGAGYHRQILRPAYKKTCKRACRAAIEKLQDGCDAVEAVAEAVKFLEDCPLTNAGIGSNLTLDGTVECDAGIMDGNSLLHSSIGSLCNIKNPIQVAKKLLIEEKEGLLPCGLVEPVILVGPGALKYALSEGFDYVDNSHLVTEMAKSSYKKHLNILKSHSVPVVEPFNSSTIDKSQSFKNGGLLDTVGAVCVDYNGHVASAVSSGGISLKRPGRLGQAAFYSCGFWAQNSKEVNKPSIACTTSGTGEYLIRTTFSKECYTQLYNKCDSVSALQDAFKEKFLNSPFLEGAKNKLGGVLTLKHYKHDNICEIDWAHNTKTMLLGYGSTETRKIVAHVSQQFKDSVCGSGIILKC